MDEIDLTHKAAETVTTLYSKWGEEVLTVFLLYPWIWYKERQNNRIIAEYKKTFEKGFHDIIISRGKMTPMNTEATIELASKFVWSAGSTKLVYIKRILERNSLIERKENIKADIKSELIKISYDEYIKPLNKYMSDVGMLGDWINDNFKMNDFLEEVYEVVFRQDKDIDRKLSDISAIMKKYQNILWYNLRILLNK